MTLLTRTLCDSSPYIDKLPQLRDPQNSGIKYSKSIFHCVISYQGVKIDILVFICHTYM